MVLTGEMIGGLAIVFCFIVAIAVSIFRFKTQQVRLFKEMLERAEDKIYIRRKLMDRFIRYDLIAPQLDEDVRDAANAIVASAQHLRLRFNEVGPWSSDEIKRLKNRADDDFDSDWKRRLSGLQDIVQYAEKLAEISGDCHMKNAIQNFITARGAKSMEELLVNVVRKLMAEREQKP